VIELLILHGAEPECWFDNDPKPLTVSGILIKVFGAERAGSLRQLIDNEKAKRPRSSWFSPPWLRG
jgi:hypothetical protein